MRAHSQAAVATQLKVELSLLCLNRCSLTPYSTQRMRNIQICIRLSLGGLELGLGW